MRRVFEALLFLLLLVIDARAESVEEFISTNLEPLKGWIVIADGDSMRRIPGTVERKGTGVAVSTFLSGISESTLVSAVVVFSGGELLSTPLHSLRIDELSTDQDPKNAVNALNLTLQNARARVQALEGELHLLNIAKRKESGLDEVDGVYERIAQYEEHIAEFERAEHNLQVLEKLVK